MRPIRGTLLTLLISLAAGCGRGESGGDKPDRASVDGATNGREGMAVTPYTAETDREVGEYLLRYEAFLTTLRDTATEAIGRMGAIGRSTTPDPNEQAAACELLTSAINRIGQWHAQNEAPSALADDQIDAYQLELGNRPGDQDSEDLLNRVATFVTQRLSGRGEPAIVEQLRGFARDLACQKGSP